MLDILSRSINLTIEPLKKMRKPVFITFWWRFAMWYLCAVSNELPGVQFAREKIYLADLMDIFHENEWILTLFSTIWTRGHSSNDIRWSKSPNNKIIGKLYAIRKIGYHTGLILIPELHRKRKRPDLGKYVTVRNMEAPCRRKGLPIAHKVVAVWKDRWLEFQVSCLGWRKLVGILRSYDLKYRLW